MKHLRRILPFAIVIAGAAVAACGAGREPPSDGGPAAAAGGVRDATASHPAAAGSAGLDEERLACGVARVRRLAGVRSLLVMRGGRIVAEESFAGDGLDRRPYDLKSASKSLLSALVGIALERGWIESVEQTVADLLPGYARDLPAEKRAITLADPAPRGSESFF